MKLELELLSVDKSIAGTYRFCHGFANLVGSVTVEARGDFNLSIVNIFTPLLTFAFM